MIAFLINMLGPFLPYIAGGFAVLLAFFGVKRAGVVKGRNKERSKQKEADNENADNIRRRVRDAKRVSDNADDIKYRD